MAWMTAEAAVAVTAGVLASSIARDRIRPGLGDRVPRCRGRGLAAARRGRGRERETRGVRLIGATFFALALYLAVEGIGDLISHARPGQSARRAWRWRVPP